MPQSVARVARPQIPPQPRYRLCPHCGFAVSPRWRRAYCARCYRTFSTGRFDIPR